MNSFYFVEIFEKDQKKKMSLCWSSGQQAKQFYYVDKITNITVYVISMC